MALVLLTRELPPGGSAPLSAHDVRIIEGPLREAPSLCEAEAIISTLTEKIDESVIDAAPLLRVVANVAVGYDNIDVAAAHARGIAVCNTPGVLDDSTADLAFLLILAATRLSSDAETDLRAGRWEGWSLMDHLGRDVHGAVLGLVGYGRIGRAVARRAEGFGIEVLHHTRSKTGFPGWLASLDDLLGTADIVSVHVPLSTETVGLIGARELSLMKPTGVLVNTTRGPVVDEEALCDALDAGRLHGAGLDVFVGEPSLNPRLLRTPRLTCLPHIGSATIETRTKMARLACEGAATVLAGGVPANLVSLS